jgi:pilus assembly protein CpaB
VKNKKTPALIISVVVALLGAFLVFKSAGSSKKDAPAPAAAAAPAEETRSVVVAKVAIPEGTRSEALASMTEIKSVPISLAGDALVSLDSVKGQVTLAALVPNEFLYPLRFASPAEAANGSLNPGNVDISVMIDGAALPQGNLAKNDIIGIVAAMAPNEELGTREAHLSIRKAKVVSISPLPPPPAEGAAPVDPALAGKRMLTLSMSDVDAERLVYFSINGTMTVIKETNESIEGPTKVVTRTNLWDSTERRSSSAPTTKPAADAALVEEAAGSATTPAEPAIGATPAKPAVVATPVTSVAVGAAPAAGAAPAKPAAAAPSAAGAAPAGAAPAAGAAPSAAGAAPAPGAAKPVAAAGN